jgi:hypothetical protein
MKRTLLVVGVTVGALAAAGIAWSSGVLGGGPAQIRVYGGGQIATPVPRTFSLDANANPDGRGAYGSFRSARVLGGGLLRGDVTCLTLAGNSALVGGFIREGEADLIGRDFLFAVSDNGPPGSGADTSGFIDLSPELDNPPYPGLPPDFPRTCPPTVDLNTFGSFPLTGDVSIETP